LKTTLAVMKALGIELSAKVPAIAWCYHFIDNF
jgi:DNA-binding phage protein